MEHPCAEKSVRFGDLTVTVRAQWHRWPGSEPPGGTTEVTITLMRDGMDARIVKTAPFRNTDLPLRCLPHETPRYAEAEAKHAVNVFLRWLGLALTDDMWGLFMELDDAYRFRPIEDLRVASSNSCSSPLLTCFAPSTHGVFRTARKSMRQQCAFVSANGSSPSPKSAISALPISRRRR
jgi:hypothetical protein